jgi:hypothetical protein
MCRNIRDHDRTSAGNGLNHRNREALCPGSHHRESGLGIPLNKFGIRKMIVKHEAAIRHTTKLCASHVLRVAPDNLKYRMTLRVAQKA